MDELWGPLNDDLFSLMPIELIDGIELEWKATVEFEERSLTPPERRVKFDETSRGGSS